MMNKDDDEIEVNFRLDEEGRTIPPPDFEVSTNDGGSKKEDPPTEETSSKRSGFLDYTSCTMVSEFRYVNSNEIDASSQNLKADVVLDDLLLDAEISDCGLMPRTFWVPADAHFEPRCSLEQLAADVFHHHTFAIQGLFDVTKSGAEWWVQIRPSPEKTGRYAMHGIAEDGNIETETSTNCMEQTGISFHWDKDEDLRLLTGGTTFVHPHLSTVTYLTGIGAPTMVFNYRVHNLSGEPLRNPKPEAFVSWPSQFKHLVFDGRFLHSAPPDLMEEGQFVQQTTMPLAPCDATSSLIDAEQKRLLRRHRRVTFLVNIWLNYQPFNVHPFPDTMLDKMSGHGHDDSNNKRRVGLSLPKKSEAHVTVEFTVPHQDTYSFDKNNELSSKRLHMTQPYDDASTERTRDETASNEVLQEFTWPMGNADSGEIIRTVLPISTIRSVSDIGGNVCIRWAENSPQVSLHRDGTSATSASTDVSFDVAETESPPPVRDGVDAQHSKRQRREEDPFQLPLS